MDVVIVKEERKKKERKNTVLLTVIAVATLLVAVVGATFAYFTATTTNTGKEANMTDVTTKEVGNTTFNLTGTDKEKKLDYPGGIAVIEAKVEASRTSGDENSYSFAYKFKVEATNGTGTELNWYLYKGTNSSASLDLSTCKLVTDTETGKAEGKTYYYYSTSDSDASGTNSCKKDLITTLNDPVASGKIAASGSASTEEDEGLSDTVTVNSDATTTQYYYLVIEYPNNGKDQTEDDKAKQITAKLSLDGNVAATPIESD